MKISQQKMHMGCSPGKYQTWGSHCPLPTESEHIAFPALISGNTWNDANKGSSARPQRPEILLGIHCIGTIDGFTAHVLVWPRIILDNIAGFSSVASHILSLSGFSQSPLCITVLDYLVEIKTLFSAL